MSIDMKNYMNSPERKNKMIMNFVCAIIMNGIFAGLYGWFAFPNSNLDTMKVWETRLAEREAYADSTAFHLAYPTPKDRMGFWSEGACFYTPTTVDGLENKIPDFVYDPNNSNQRCITCEFQMGIFIWFVLALVNVVFSMILLCAFTKQSNGVFKFFNSLLSCANCFGFVVFILLSCTRWSEAGRACSGEFMMTEEQSAVQTDFGVLNMNEFYTACVEGGAEACKAGDVFLAPTIQTGFFLKVVLILAWIGIGLGCCCCCCTMCMFCGMMKKKGEQLKADAANVRGSQVMNTDISASNVSATEK